MGAVEYFIMENFKNAVEKFVENLSVARSSPFSINSDLKGAMTGMSDIVKSLNNYGDLDQFKVNVSVGQGNWSNVAWLCVLDRSVTESTQDGLYIAMLFNKALDTVFIGLGLGVTAYQQSGGLGLKALKEHVEALRASVKITEDLRSSIIWNGDYDLGANGRLPDGYKLGTVFTKSYKVSELPSDLDLERYLAQIDMVVMENANLLSDLKSGELKIGSVSEPSKSYGDYIETEELEILEDTLFWDEDKESRAHYSWFRKKNLILQGAPGVGKTFWADKMSGRVNESEAYSMPEGYCGMSPPPPEEAIFRCQFHQSTSYEDFVEGYRPTKEGGFELKNGIFVKAVNYALTHPNEHTVIIIDEINRGNISKIFGELLSLIEADKRDQKWAVSLNYSSRKFWVPPNLYILGMMNTADKSLSVVDYALRRRFVFVDVSPAFDSPCFDYLLAKKGISENFVHRIKEGVNKINEVIRNEPQLGVGFEIGHSYFIPQHDVVEEDRWLRSVVDDEIAPLLSEYFFDSQDLVDEFISYFN